MAVHSVASWAHLRVEKTDSQWAAMLDDLMVAPTAARSATEMAAHLVNRMAG